MNALRVAIVYQSHRPPEINGIVKPMKDGGYSDSGADVAFALRQNEIEVITPTNSPNIKNNFDWVFPDSEDGIKAAMESGATLFWLNTVLYSKQLSI